MAPSTPSPSTDDLQVCPTSRDLESLVQAPNLERGRPLVRHLLRCGACWQRLAEMTGELDLQQVSPESPLSMALLTAAQGIERPLTGRFLHMRPLHRHDAWKASRSPIAFGRLLLHETLAANLRCADDHDLSSFEVSDIWIKSCFPGILSSPIRRDLTALCHTYRAYSRLLRGDLETTDFYLAAADELMQRGAGKHEPRVTWWVLCSGKERLLALMERFPEPSHLASAVHCLQQALRRLPVRGFEEQRAELLHDQAHVCRLQGRLALADRLLSRAETLLVSVSDTAGPLLSSMVALAQANVEAERTLSYTNPEDRQRSAERVWDYFGRATQNEYLDDAELRHETRRLMTRLTPPSLLAPESTSEDEVPS